MERKYTPLELSWLIRRHVIEMAHLSGGSHIASALSCADVLTVLYSDILYIDPTNTSLESRDYFVMSKGHAGSALYAALAETGFFDTEVLKTHYQNGSILSGHVSHKTVPGVEVSTGSLGHGLSYAVGMAYALKKDKKPNRVFCLVGDGECQEGAVWEAINLAQQLKLDNLIVLVDYNKMQAMGMVDDIISLEPFLEKFKSFNCDAYQIDGHNHDLIASTINDCLKQNNKPHVIICDTIKGKGVGFMEMDLLWHYRYPHDGEEYENAIKEISKTKPEGLKDPYEE